MPDEETMRKIRIYWNHKYSFAEIAEETGCTFGEINRVLRETGREERALYGELEEKAEKAVKIFNKEELNLSTKKWTSPETKEEIIRLSNETTMSQGEIAEAVGVSRQTVNRVILKEKEPATVAAAASSGENTHENISENIVTDFSENVKTPRFEFFNGAEEEAVIGAVSDRIELYTKKISELTESAGIYKRKRDMLCKFLTRNGYKDVLPPIGKEETPNEI